MNELKKFRTISGETQKESAENLGISLSKYQKAEQGIQGVSDRLKIKMAIHFNTTVEALFFSHNITNSNNDDSIITH